MKIRDHILILSLFLAAGCSHQQSFKPSPAVLASFESRFGDKVNARWESAGEKVYMASYTYSGHPSKSYFDGQGKWIKTETELLSSELPSIIIQTVLGAYTGSSISKSLQIEESDHETFFRLSLKRGGRISEVDLSSGGVILPTPNLR